MAEEVTRSTVLTGMQAAEVRQIARREIASLAALVLRRLQEEHPTRSPDRNMADDAVRQRMSAVFAEALADFSGHTGGGDAPGPEA